MLNYFCGAGIVGLDPLAGPSGWTLLGAARGLLVPCGGAGRAESSLEPDSHSPPDATAVGASELDAVPPRHPMPATHIPSITVVITTCAQPQSLLRCVDSILAGQHQPMEIVAVENRPAGSPTQAQIEQRYGRDPRIRYVEEPRRGLSHARNAGLRVARGEVTVFTDDDIVAGPGWLRAIGERFMDPRVACVTGLIAPLSLESPAQVMFERLASFGKGTERARHSLRASADEPLFPFAAGAFGSGANTALRTAAARRLGGVDTALGAGTPSAGGEDLDCFARVLLDGGTIAYEPAAVIYHDHPSRRDALV